MSGGLKLGEAQARLLRLEENLRLIEAGRLELPEGADVATFLLSDGKLNGRPVVPATVVLCQLFDRYCESLPDGAMEASSLYTTKIHIKHLRYLDRNNYPTPLYQGISTNHFSSPGSRCTWASIGFISFRARRIPLR